MPKHKVTSSTGKRGVTFVRDVVEAANCLFHKIEKKGERGRSQQNILLHQKKTTHV